ncbi:MAG: hypothetical protein U1F35_14730 [Steroidobacteraceae bacterium]
MPDGGGNPLNKHAAFLECQCPKCGQPARREADAMDTFSKDSSWYFLRFASSRNLKAMVDERAAYWMPSGSVHRRHRARHPAPLIFALLGARHERFESGEAARGHRQPVHAGHGAERGVLQEAGQRAHQCYNPADVELKFDAAGARAGSAVRCAPTARRWNRWHHHHVKSKNNGVDPQALVEQYGAGHRAAVHHVRSPSRADAQVVG